MSGAENPFAAFEGLKYLSLETFRKNGEGVRTPVWFAAGQTDRGNKAAAVIYIYTIGDTGKVKRIRNNPRVRIAPCDMRGNVTGDFVEARAEILSAVAAVHGTQLLNRKYFPWKQVLGFFALFSRRERLVMALRPV
jgi:PPOX class probable F420-dependent enzyme